MKWTFARRDMTSLQMHVFPERDRIFIKGDRCTSNDLVTSVQTVQLLHDLALSPDGKLRAEELPWLKDSSYFPRNQFEGQILTKLRKTVMARLGCELAISVSGEINDYQIISHCDGGQTSIAVIQPLEPARLSTSRG